MCFNEKTSWTTLIMSVIITILTISYVSNMSKNHKDKNKVIALILLWQYAALMQIPEALAWRNINNKSSPSMNFCSRLAFALNVTQPIITFLLIYYIMKPTHKSPALYFSFIATCIYILSWMYIFFYLQNWNWDIAPKTKCDHLNLGWWQSKLYLIMLYLIAIITSYAMLGTKYMIFSTVILLGTLLLSTLIYKCGVGSIWCWIAAFMGLATTVFHVVDKYYNNLLIVF